MNIRESARLFVEVVSMAFWATLYLLPVLFTDRIHFEYMLESGSLPASKVVLWIWVFLAVIVHSEMRRD